MTPELFLLSLLLVKHFLGDFVLQSDFIVENRRRYGHPGGLLHTGIHGALSLVAFLIFGAPFSGMVIGLIVAEMIIHYHIDWGKDNLTRQKTLNQNDRSFWTLFGLDQLLHQATYVAMVAVWFQL